MWKQNMCFLRLQLLKEAVGKCQSVMGYYVLLLARIIMRSNGMFSFTYWKIWR